MRPETAYPWLYEPQASRTPQSVWVFYTFVGSWVILVNWLTRASTMLKNLISVFTSIVADIQYRTGIYCRSYFPRGFMLYFLICITTVPDYPTYFLLQQPELYTTGQSVRISDYYVQLQIRSAKNEGTTRKRDYYVLHWVIRSVHNN